TSYGHLYVTLNRPAILPVGESLPNSAIFRRLAHRMGLTEPEFMHSDVELIEQALTSGDERLEGITFERLLANGYARLNLPESFTPYAEPGKFSSPSGRIEIFSRRLE